MAASQQAITILEHKESISYSNALHDSLINKNGKVFRKTWKSKFETKTKYEQIDCCVDKNEIAEKFAKHFSDACSNVITDRANNLKLEYSEKRADYYGLPLLPENLFDIELVDRIYYFRTSAG
jgi:DNA polymerase elongation subunit (family B)